MSEHQERCDVCDQIIACESGTLVRMIAEMESGWAVMGPHQVFEGYSLLLLRWPATEIFELKESQRQAMWRDLTSLASAVAAVTGCHKLNYEALGNVCHHLHWHIFPRQLSEQEPTSPVWTCMPTGAAADPFAFDPMRHESIRLAIRDVLNHLGEG